jgi:hypothetical protein
MFLLVGLLLERNGQQMPHQIWNRLEGMCDAVQHLRTPTGRVCPYGDWDNGRTVVLDDSDVDDFRSMLCTGAVRFERGDFKAAAGAFREESLWLLGPEAPRCFEALPARPPASWDRAFADGGIYVWRTGPSAKAEYVWFKCGPFDSHTHADNLAVLYSAGGKDWLVDRGTYTYNGPWEWRTYFRGTRAHNAVVVDGFGQTLAHRAFRWLKHPRQRVYHSRSDEPFGYVAGGTDGFGHLSSPVRHDRSVLVVKGQYVIVCDALTGSGSHTYELLWHVDPAHEVTVTPDGLARTHDRDGPNLWMHAIGTADLAANVVMGQTDPIQGWHSTGYGHKCPAPTIVYRTRATGALHLVTLWTTLSDELAGHETAAASAIRLCFEPDPPEGAVLVRATAPSFDSLVCMPNPGRLSSSAFPSDRLWIESRGTVVHPFAPSAASGRQA